MLKQDACGDVAQWVRGALADAALPTVVPGEMQEHVATCATCQGALVALLAGSSGALPAPMDCATFLDALPGFVDDEVAGRAGDRADLGAILWHRWTCAACAEVYEHTHRLVAAERTGLLPSPPSATRPDAQLPHLLVSLSRQFLRAAFPQERAGEMRGEAESVVLVDAPVAESRHIRLCVQERPDTTAQVVVTVAPAPVGQAVLRLGGAQYRAPFTSGGSATIADIPMALLARPDGPDLLVELEPDAAPARDSSATPPA